MRFHKMHGLGNDFILINGFTEKIPADLSATAKAICHRKTGIGADGLIILSPSDKAAFKFSIYNDDGSQAEMCGNGIRCAAMLAYKGNIVTEKTFYVETLAGIMRPEIIDMGKGIVSVDMGIPILAAAKISTLFSNDTVINAPLAVGEETFFVTCVSMGNPHCVIFVDKTDEYPVEKIGPRIENHPFFPNKTNVEFVQVISAEKIRMRVWERGCGITLACGTGAAAAVAAAYLNDHTGRKVEVELALGSLLFDWHESDGHMLMEGPAAEVFSGEYKFL